MSLKILVVEDEVIIAETIKIFLLEYGYTVTDLCISYDEAVASYQHNKPDLAILDIRLYGKRSGIEFAQYLNHQPDKIPFLYLNAQHDQQTFDRAFATVPQAYLVKPIQKKSLWATIKTIEKHLQLADAEYSLKVYDGQKHFHIKERDILFIKSEHVYSNLHLVDNRTVITRIPLSQIAEELKSNFLIRCHRSYIVNTKYVSIWDKTYLNLQDGRQIPVSRSNKTMITKRLNLDI